jgi:hypothetical protein
VSVNSSFLSSSCLASRKPNCWDEEAPMKSSLLEHENLLSEGSCCPNTFTRTAQVCQGCSTLLSSAQLSQVAAQNGKPPLQPHFFFWKGIGEELQRVKRRCLRFVFRAFKATPVRWIQAEVGIPLSHLHMDSWQACFCLKSEKSVIDKVIGEGYTKVI